MTFARAKDVMPIHQLKYQLHKELSGYDPARPMKNVHASELTKPEGFCPRAYALHDVTEIKPKDRYLNTSLSMTFEIGRMVQNHVVHKFADMGKAIDHWECLACGKVHEFQLRPSKCLKCACKAFKPKEVRFLSDKNGASVGVDMLIANGQPKLTPVEIKTIAPEEFKALAMPLAEHKQRTALGLRIISESTHPWSELVDTKRAIVLYVSKGGFGVSDPTLKGMGFYEGFSPFKEWPVTRDDALCAEQAKRAQAVKDFRDGAAPMPCGICPTAMAKRALSCPWKAPCFSGEHPPLYDWTKA
jgi:hypothetical protein